MGTRSGWARLEERLGWSSSGSPNWIDKTFRSISRCYGAMAAGLLLGACFNWGLVIVDAWTAGGTFVQPGAVVGTALTAFAVAFVWGRRPVASAAQRWRRDGHDGLSEDEWEQLARVRDRLDGASRWGGSMAQGHLDAWVGWAASVALHAALLGILWTLLVWTLLEGEINPVGTAMVAGVTAFSIGFIGRVWLVYRWGPEPAGRLR